MPLYFLIVRENISINPRAFPRKKIDLQTYIFIHVIAALGIVYFIDFLDFLDFLDLRDFVDLRDFFAPPDRDVNDRYLRIVDFL